MAFLGQEEQLRDFQDRFKYLYAVLFISLAVLVSRLIFLQILQGDQMRRTSEENRIKKVRIAAPRGMIFDRNRSLLIDNQPAFDLEITPQYLRESKREKEVVERLSSLIHMPVTQVNALIEKARQSQAAFRPVKIKTDLDRDDVAGIETWKLDMPGVNVETEIKRTAIYGDVASHFLGHVAKVTPHELPELNRMRKEYDLHDVIGKVGIEKQLENTLKGRDGQEFVEVDALGRRIRGAAKGRILTEDMFEDAVPGNNIVLTIDQDLQLAAARAFGNKSGGLVAIDPHTGAILAMISRPSFDPTAFSSGISGELWKKLLSNENHPLRDKTIQDHYSPGSVFKVVTAIAGLEEGVINENTTFNCPGKIWVGNRPYHCHKKYGHGNMNVISALAQSCDVFFYRLSQKLKGVDTLAAWSKRLGLGELTHVGLPREIAGLIPTEDWKKRRFGKEWMGGETLSVAIGQGFLLTTVLQLANMFSAIGNGGTLYKPFFVKTIESADGSILSESKLEMLKQTRISPNTIDIVKKGLWGVMNSPRGTGYWQRLPGMDFVGKTGTTQVIRLTKEKIYEKCIDLKYRFRHHGFFAGFAPAKDPVIAVAIVAEHTCGGATGAAPIAREVVKTYLQKYFPELYSDQALKIRGDMLTITSPIDRVDEELEEEDIINDPTTFPVTEDPLPEIEEEL